jgi:hypothetical protein
VLQDIQAALCVPGSQQAGRRAVTLRPARVCRYAHSLGLGPSKAAAVWQAASCVLEGCAGEWRTTAEPHARHAATRLQHGSQAHALPVRPAGWAGRL